MCYAYFGAIRQKLKILWHFEIFVNTGPYWAGNFKALLLLHIFDPIWAKLYMINKVGILECKLINVWRSAKQ